MATNPWICLRTRVRTLCTRAIHAGAAMVLCLGLTTTAASAAGGGGVVPLAGRPMALTVEQQAMFDDMASQAEVIYEIASGQRPVMPFEPIVIDWFALGEVDSEPSELFALSAAQINAGAFAGGTLVSDPAAYMEVQFDTPVVLVWEDAGEPEPIRFAPDSADEPRVVSMGMVRGSLIGQAGSIDDVTFAVVGMEFWAVEGPMRMVGIVPFGIGLPWPEEEVQEVEQQLLVLPLIGAGAVVVGAGYWVYGGNCPKTLRFLEDNCVADCTAKIVACFPLPNGDCELHYSIARCVTCCKVIRRQSASRCRFGGLGTYGPIEEKMAECVEHAHDWSFPLPGDDSLAQYFYEYGWQDKFP